MPSNHKNNPYSNSYFGGQSDPYSWAGEVGVEEGKVPIQKWRPSIMVTKISDAETKKTLTETTSERAHPERSK